MCVQDIESTGFCMGVIGRFLYTYAYEAINFLMFIVIRLCNSLCSQSALSDCPMLPTCAVFLDEFSSYSAQHHSIKAFAHKNFSRNRKRMNCDWSVFLRSYD